MATRNDRQVGITALKYIDIINDYVDTASYILQDIDPQNGGPYLDKEGQPFSVVEIKSQLAKIRSNLRIYYNNLNNYVAKVGVQRLAIAMDICGISAVTAKADMENLVSVIETAIPQVQAATTKVEFALIGNYIDDNTEKLELIRRTWAL